MVFPKLVGWNRLHGVHIGLVQSSHYLIIEF